MALTVTGNSQDCLINAKGDTLYKLSYQQLHTANIRLVERNHYKILTDSLYHQVNLLKSINFDHKQAYDQLIDMVASQGMQIAKHKKIVEEKDKIIELHKQKVKIERRKKNIFIVLFAITSIIAVVK